LIIQALLLVATGCLGCQSVTCRGSVDTVERRTQICAMCLVSAIAWYCDP
jgi:hypothetical protein